MDGGELKSLMVENIHGISWPYEINELQRYIKQDVRIPLPEPAQRANL